MAVLWRSSCLCPFSLGASQVGVCRLPWTVGRGIVIVPTPCSYGSKEELQVILILWRSEDICMVRWSSQQGQSRCWVHFCHWQWSHTVYDSLHFYCVKWHHLVILLDLQPKEHCFCLLQDGLSTVFSQGFETFSERIPAVEHIKSSIYSVHKLHGCGTTLELLQFQA